MAKETVTCEVTVINEQGLHLRPADALVQLAQKFDADIELLHDGACCDATVSYTHLTLPTTPYV